MLAKIILIIAGATIDGAIAFVLTGWLLGPTHNIGQLMGQAIVAAVVALLTAIGGWYWVIR